MSGSDEEDIEEAAGAEGTTGTSGSCISGNDEEVEVEKDV